MTGPIQIEERQSASWAQESTLRQLAQLTTDTNQILIKIAKSRDVNIDPNSLKKFADSTGSAVPAIKRFTTATEEGGRGFKRSIDDLRSTMDQLEYRTRSYSDNIAGVIRGSSDPLKALPGMFGRLGAGLGGLAGRIPVLSTTLAVLGASAGALVGMYMESADAYRQMIQTGILFDGSVEGMIRSVRSSGVSLQAASQIIQNRSQAIIVGGEQQFFDTVGNMTSTFARFGMTMDQGAETLSELMDQQRLSSSLFSMSQQEIIAANTVTLNQMQAQQRLTGISLRQQLEERRRVAQRAEMRVMAAQLQGPERERYNQMLSAMTNMGVPEEAAAGMLLQAFGKGTTRAGALAQQTLGPEFTSMIMQAAQTGDVSQLRSDNPMLSSGLQRMLELLSPAAIARGGISKEMADILLPILERTQPATLGPTAEARQTQAETAARGQSLLQEGTLAYYNTVNNAQQAMGRLQTTITDMLAPAMNTLFHTTNDLATSFNNVLGILQRQGLSAAGTELARMGLAGGTQMLQLAADNPLATAGVAGAGALAAQRMMQATTMGGGTASAGGAPGATGAARPGGFLRRAGGRILGLEQLFSAGSAAYEGNFAEAAGHAGLFLLRRNPLAMAASALDFLMEETTGQGLVARGANLMQGLQSPPTLTPPTLPTVSTGAEVALMGQQLGSAMNMALQPIYDRLDMLNSRLDSTGVVAQSLINIANYTNDTRNILSDRL